MIGQRPTKTHETASDIAVVHRVRDWLVERALLHDQLRIPAEDPEVIKLMAHQRSFLM